MDDRSRPGEPGAAPECQRDDGSPRPTVTQPGAPIGRRVVLGMLGLGAIGIVGGRSIGNGVGAVLAPLRRGVPTGLTSLIPGGDHFRLYTVTSGYPTETVAAYRLRVDGLVERPATYDLAGLQALTHTSLVRDFQCVTGWRVPKVHWTGVSLADLLHTAGVRPGAKAVHFESFDRSYTESLTLDQARRRDVLVAWSMLGAPVTRDHGGPVRLYVAPMYGYKSIKWLSRIEVVDRVEPGYWEQTGQYDVNAWVGKSNGRSDPATA